MLDLVVGALERVEECPGLLTAQSLWGEKLACEAGILLRIY